ncbi:MAG: MerR family transcriptional regulator [Proteobacteria bacterium]|nr:MerR family transcriptional regulator [Pseudomonadota bacterium]
MGVDKYTTKTIVEKLGIPLQRLRMWLMEDFVSASIPSEGQGKKAFFTREDLYHIVLFEKLLKKGLKRELAAAYIKSINGGTSILDSVPYLVLITINTDEGNVVQSRNCLGFNPLQPIISPDNFMMSEFESDVEKTDWEDVLIINYVKLRKEVDKMLNESNTA